MSFILQIRKLRVKSLEVCSVSTTSGFCGVGISTLALGNQGAFLLLPELSSQTWVSTQLLASSNAGFLTLDIIDTLDQINFAVGGWPVHCRMFSSVLGLYPLDAGSNLQLRPPEMCPDIATYPVRDKTSLILKPL